MNMLLHGVEDFDIVQGDTLEFPKHLNSGRLQQYNVVLANPPYSVNKWNRTKWKSDPFGRNIWGTPPQSFADYAFIQHIHSCMRESDGRAAILLPNGILFRDAEESIRKKMIQSGCIKAVIGLGENLFYNSPMEACILILDNRAAPHNEILFIDGHKEIVHERGSSFLSERNIERISNAYMQPRTASVPSRIVPLSEVKRNNFNLNIPLYINRYNIREFSEFKELSFSLPPTINASLNKTSYMAKNIDESLSRISSLSSDFCSDFALFRFDELAENISKRIDPNATDLEYYVGLEHVDPFGSFITRWGSPEDVKGSKLIAKKGDLIFGKRRSYLRKSGILPFDCICSAHSFVLREKTNHLVPGFLIILLHSEEFYRVTQSISEGSLSPTIKWKNLAGFEFLIPPKSIQLEMINLFQRIEDLSKLNKAVMKDFSEIRTVITNISQIVSSNENEDLHE